MNKTLRTVLKQLPSGLTRRDFDELYSEYVIRELLPEGEKGTESHAGAHAKKSKITVVVPISSSRSETGERAGAHAGAQAPTPASAHVRARERARAWVRKPTHKAAVAIWEDERGSSKKSDFTPLALLGFYYKSYREWCLADYRNESLPTHYQLMLALVERESPEMVHAAISALFVPRGPLDWVTRKDLGFLTNLTNWSRFVAPAIARLKSHGKGGEQAEYRGAAEGVVVRKG